jgi:ribosomal protein S8
LNVFETLKGAGAITDTEGTKGTSAILRLKLSLSPSEYREAIKEFKEVVEKGMRKAERDAAEYYSLQLRRSPPGGN